MALVDSNLSNNKLTSILATMESAIAKGASIGEAVGSVIEKGSRGKPEVRGSEKGNQGGSGEGRGNSGR